jgi:hypothetical protein
MSPDLPVVALISICRLTVTASADKLALRSSVIVERSVRAGGALLLFISLGLLVLFGSRVTLSCSRDSEGLGSCRLTQATAFGLIELSEKAFPADALADARIGKSLHRIRPSLDDIHAFVSIAGVSDSVLLSTWYSRSREHELFKVKVKLCMFWLLPMLLTSR